MTHTFPKSILIRITILALLLCVIIGAKVYLTRETSLILKDIRTHYTQVASIRAARDTSVSFLSSFAAVKGNESSIRAALPQADYIVPFRDAVENAATRVSAKITTTYANPVATEFTLPPSQNSTSSLEQIYRIETSFIIDGDARALEQFLTELEALPYYFTVNSMKSITSEIDGWEAGTRTTITGTLYAVH